MEIRLFMGYVEAGELRNQLLHSQLWKEDNELRLSMLHKIEHQQKYYIGFFIPLLLNLSQIYEKEEQLKKQLQVYCPQLNLEACHCKIFPQTFIS